MGGSWDEWQGEPGCRWDTFRAPRLKTRFGQVSLGMLTRRPWPISRNVPLLANNTIWTDPRFLEHEVEVGGHKTHKVAIRVV